jgi:photosystem II stability/assembly factor-like uncharacterized protein
MRSLQLLASRSSRIRSVGAAGQVLIATIAALAVLLPPAVADDDALEWSTLARLAPRSLLLDLAAADGRLVAVGERGHVLISDDAGQTWRQVRVPTRSNLTGVFFLDRERGWAVGHDAVILRTADGGETWERVHWAPEKESPLFDVWFSSPFKGIAVGAYGSYYVTADGGASWKEKPISEDDAHLHRLARAADGLLYLAGEAGVLYRSDDGGESWKDLPSPYEGSFFGVLPLADKVVLAFGLRGHLYRSEDAGETWVELDSGTTAMLTDGVVMADGTVLVVGLGGAVLLSDDGGRSFTFKTPADRRGIAGVVEGAPGVLVMVGEFGARAVPVRELRTAAGAAEGGGTR